MARRRRGPRRRATGLAAHALRRGPDPRRDRARARALHGLPAVGGAPSVDPRGAGRGLTRRGGRPIGRETRRDGGRADDRAHGPVRGRPGRGRPGAHDLAAERPHGFST